jgi:hypothetical protein
VGFVYIVAVLTAIVSTSARIRYLVAILMAIKIAAIQSKSAYAD